MPADPRLVAMMLDSVVNAPVRQIGKGPLASRLASGPKTPINIPMPAPPLPQPSPISDASPGISPDSPPNDTATAPDGSVPVPPGERGKVILGDGMDRPGVKTHSEVIDAVAAIAAIYGKPLTIGTGTNHNQYVAGTNHESHHWTGWAADVPMAGDSLTRLGQDALIMAGMSPAEAAKQTGGVFNVGPYNILFNTNVGGNHYNHLHIGIRH